MQYDHGSALLGEPMNIREHDLLFLFKPLSLDLVLSELNGRPHNPSILNTQAMLGYSWVYYGGRGWGLPNYRPSTDGPGTPSWCPVSATGLLVVNAAEWAAEGSSGSVH